MKLFSEKVSPTLTNSPLNILQVKDYEEVFFGVYEIEINETKYPVEKISEHNGNPVVSVPVTLRGEKKMFPFVLSKGKFEILFNENNTLDSDDTFVSTPLITESVVSDPIDIFVEDVETLPKVDNNKKKILSQIKRAKREASEYASKIKKQKIDEANVVIDSKKKALDKMIEEARSSLVDEFISISNKIKVEFIDESDNRFGEIKETIDNKIIDLSNSLSDGLKNEFSNSAIQLESKVKELVGAIHLAIKPKINKEFEDLSNLLDKKVKNVSNKIDEKVQNIEKSIEHVEINLDSKFSSKVDSIIESNVELNNKINKGVNKALSRVGNVDKHIEELVEDFNSKISNAEKNILEYYTDKIELLEKNAFDFNENTRKFFVESIEESRNNLIQEIRKLKDSKPIEYIIESKDENIKIKSDDLLKDLDKKINKKIDDEVTRLRKYISVYGGGGGTVAMQFADGGTMNGNLTVVGTISASQYLGIPIYTDTDTLSTVTGRGNTTTDSITVGGVTVLGGLTADRIFTNNLEALSANITVLDIKQYELSGFNVQGDATIQGSVSASGNIAASSMTISGNPVATVVDPVRTTLTGNGILSTFAINGANNIVNPSALIVAIDGALQEPVVDYTVSGESITFTEPLDSGAKAVVISPTNTLQVSQNIPADGSVTSAKLDTNLTVAENLSIPNQSTNNLTGALNQNTLLQSGNKYRMMTRSSAQNSGVGSSSDAYLVVGMGCQITNNNGTTASSYTYESIASHAAYSGASMKSNMDLEAYFHGVMLRVEANENWVMRINFGVGTATRVPPLAGVVAATARQWGVEIYYDTINNDFKLRMYWYDTSINYGTPITIPALTAANWQGFVYSIRMRQTSTGLLEFYISTPNGLGEGAGDIPSTPLTSMQATWTNVSYGGRHINFEVAAATAAAPSTQVRIHASTMHCAYK
jgi:hypothetical protein